MTIDNHCGEDDEMNPGSQAQAHSLIALEQSALYAARLAITRWINSSADPALWPAQPQPVSPRAAWYARAQQDFQEWLGRGGFAQYDIARPAPADPSAAGTLGSEVQPLAAPAPLQTPTMYKPPARINTCIG